MFFFKIWVIACILMTAYGGSPDLEADPSCDEESEECSSEDPERAEFPEIMEALNTTLMCQEIILKLLCLPGFQGDCVSFKDISSPTFNELALQACEEDSKLFQDFGDNLTCIQSFIKNHSTVCPPLAEESMESIRVVINPDYVGKKMCLWDGFYKACSIARVGLSCGPEIKAFVFKMADRVGYLHEECQPVINNEGRGMKEMIRRMEKKIAPAEITPVGSSEYDEDYSWEEEFEEYSIDPKRAEFHANIEALTDYEPETLTYYEPTCQDYITYLLCLPDLKGNCYFPFKMNDDDISGTVNSLAFQACDEDSELFHDFGHNLTCIQSFIHNYSDVCRQLAEEPMKSIKVAFDSDYDLIDTCLYHGFYIACFITRVGLSCGPETEAFVSKMVDRIGYLQEECLPVINKEGRGMEEMIRRMKEKFIPDDDFCEEGMERCYYETNGAEIPKNIDDLDPNCPGAITATIDCLSDYKSRCFKLDKILPTFHQDLAKYSSRIKLLMKQHDFCQSTRVFFNELDIQKNMCLHRAFYIECSVSRVGWVCGYEARALAAKLADRIGFLSAPCQAYIDSGEDKSLEEVTQMMENRILYYNMFDETYGMYWHEDSDSILCAKK